MLPQNLGWLLQNGIPEAPKQMLPQVEPTNPLFGLFAGLPGLLNGSMATGTASQLGNQYQTQSNQLAGTVRQGPAAPKAAKPKRKRAVNDTELGALAIGALLAKLLGVQDSEIGNFTGAFMGVRNQKSDRDYEEAQQNYIDEQRQNIDAYGRDVDAQKIMLGALGQRVNDAQNYAGQQRQDWMFNKKASHDAIKAEMADARRRWEKYAEMEAAFRTKAEDRAFTQEQNNKDRIIRRELNEADNTSAEQRASTMAAGQMARQRETYNDPLRQSQARVNDARVKSIQSGISKDQANVQFKIGKLDEEINRLASEVASVGSIPQGDAKAVAAINAKIARISEMQEERDQLEAIRDGFVPRKPFSGGIGGALPRIKGTPGAPPTNKTQLKKGPKKPGNPVKRKGYTISIK